MQDKILKYIVDRLAEKGIEVVFDDKMTVATLYNEENTTLYINRRKSMDQDVLDGITDMFDIPRTDCLRDDVWNAHGTNFFDA